MALGMDGRNTASHKGGLVGLTICAVQVTCRKTISESTVAWARILGTGSDVGKYFDRHNGGIDLIRIDHSGRGGNQKAGCQSRAS